MRTLDHNRMAFIYADNRSMQILDVNGKLWEHRYDEKGRLIESITPLNALTGHTYNAKGRTQTFEWDDHGFLKTRITPPAREPASSTTPGATSPRSSIPPERPRVLMIAPIEPIRDRRKRATL